jgi:hypothetical protein
MSRRIITSQHQAAVAGAPKLDGFFDRVLKYIPADVVAAWTAVRGLVEAAQGVPKDTVLWIAAAVGLVFTALWTHKNTKVEGQPPAKTQIAMATAAFAVWVIAIGNPPVNWNALYGSLLLIAFTLFSGLIVPKE